MDAQPLVSCIMPTYNRRRFVPHAIEYFLRQDYPNKELIVVDDGSDPVRDLMPDDSRIRYIQLDKKRTLGAKLNLACDTAQGDIIAHWDDDDWYAPRRLRYQVDALAQEGIELCGLNRLLYYDLLTGRGFQYVYPMQQRMWLLGSELCYFKHIWRRHQFRDINVGMDAHFVWSAPTRSVLALGDYSFAVHMIHANNVSPKQTQGSYWKPCPLETIQHILDRDWAIYQHERGISGDYPRQQVSERVRPAHTVANSQPGIEPVRPARNIFACLVHESRECVLDLVRNLRCLDPDSVILLYNGGGDRGLLNHGFPFNRYNTIVHPSPKPMRWGALHGFALDCMQFALDHLSFDTLTIVDSDQLGTQPGYSRYLGKALSGTSGVGMFVNSPERQPSTTRVPPAVQAWKEFELWRPLLCRFPNGKDRFVHWSFWPSTVFTADSVKALVSFFKTDAQLSDILARSRMWATEEVLFPTISALLGFQLVKNPCSYEFVRYRSRYTQHQIDSAFARPTVFWVHPVTRHYGDGLRTHIRARLNHYVESRFKGGGMPMAEARPQQPILLTCPILSQMKKVEGWLEEEEADLLIAASARSLMSLPGPHALVEVGSYCGRSTVVLGAVAKQLSPGTKVYAIDPHDGKVGALDQGVRSVAPTFEKFKRHITAAQLSDVVVAIQKHSYDVIWDRPISFLFVDGLHDYANVARDFYQFERWVVPNGLIAFHDYADYYPGVKAFVDELLSAGGYQKICLQKSMMVIQRLSAGQA
jgi:glycosyltransferase involved in cell wall biosynthesis